MLLDEGSGDVAPLELLDGERAAKELDVGGQADDLVVLEGFVERLDGLGPAWGVHNQLGNHGVIVSGDLIALPHRRVYPHDAGDLLRLP